MKPPLPVPERFCKNCKNKVEDEKPFILYCPLYKNLRNKYIINEESVDREVCFYKELQLTA
jgi:hypothetical protein